MKVVNTSKTKTEIAYLTPAPTTATRLAEPKHATNHNCSLSQTSELTRIERETETDFAYLRC